MAAVDNARVLLHLKAHLLTKRSHGSRELLEEIARLEVESEIPEAEEGYDPAPRRLASAGSHELEAPSHGLAELPASA